MTRAGRSVLGIGLIAGALMLFGVMGCGLFIKEAPAPPLAPMAVPFESGSTAVWITPSTGMTLLSSEAQRNRLLDAWVDAGVDAIYLQTRGAAGPHILAESSPERLEAFLAHARERGIGVVAAVPLFAGVSSDPEELPHSYAFSPQLSRAEIRPGLSDGEQRLTPASAAVRRRAVDEAASWAGFDWAALALTHTGFGSDAADFSPTARAAFELATGRPVRQWPEDIRAYDAAPGGGIRAQAGARWSEWVNWRANVIKSTVREVRIAVDDARRDAGLARLPLHLVCDGYYPLAMRDGTNWASPESRLIGVHSTAGAVWSQETGVATLVDAVILHLPVPIARVPGARQEGLEWWASTEGALQVARAVLDPETRIGVLLPDGGPDMADRTTAAWEWGAIAILGGMEDAAAIPLPAHPDLSAVSR